MENSLTPVAEAATATAVPANAEGRFGGIAIALFSAGCFAVSGPFAKALFTLGWTPGAAILVRVCGGAILLTLLAVAARRAPWRAWARRPLLVTAFGVVGVLAAPLCYFNAVATLPISTAMLIEYTAPVIVFMWVWMRTGVRPSRLTASGAVIAMVGLVVVVGVGSPSGMNPTGLLWASGAAVFTAALFVLSAGSSGRIDALSLTSGGMIVGTTVLIALGVLGVVPLAAESGIAHVNTLDVPWWFAVAVLAVISAPLAFSTSVVATVRLGARPASFLALTEVLFAIVIAWMLLGEVPSPSQAIGAVVVITGLVAVQAGERRVSRRQR